MKKVVVTGAYNIGKLGGDGVRKAAREAADEPPFEGQLAAVGAALLGHASPHEGWDAGKCVQRKIQGYRAQDRSNRSGQPPGDLTLDGVLGSLLACKLECYYCRKRVKVLYKKARDPAQWTLDRLDNDLVHTMDNTVVACMKCNLRRRCQNSDDYRATKQMVVVRRSAAEQVSRGSVHAMHGPVSLERRDEARENSPVPPGLPGRT